MAINVNSTPSTSAFNEVGNCIKFNFTMTDIGSGTITRRFGYQLKDKDDNPITNKESFSPKVNTPFDIDFRRDILPFVRTLPPTDNADGGVAIPQDEMWIEIKLEYWEIVHDSETCETTEENLMTTGLFIVVNSASNWFFPVEKAPAALLNRKPNYIQCNRKTEDFLYYFKYTGAGSGATTIEATIYGDNGSVIGDRGPYIIADGMNAYPVGPGNFYNTLNGNPDGAPKSVRRIRVFTNQGDIVNYIIDPCDSDTGTTLFFQTTDGGYSGIYFDNVQRSIKSTYTEVCRYNPACEVWDFENLKNAGESISDKKSYKEITFVKHIEDEDPIDLQYYEQFLASGSYYALVPWRYTEIDGRLRMVKFLPYSGNLVYFREERTSVLTIRGKINVPYNMPNYAT